MVLEPVLYGKSVGLGAIAWPNVGPAAPKPVQVRPCLFDSPLTELCPSSPSDVISRYSTSATKDGSTHVAFGFLTGLVSFDFGLIDDGIELLADLGKRLT
jgi:hypothetical protein